MSRPLASLAATIACLAMLGCAHPHDAVNGPALAPAQTPVQLQVRGLAALRAGDGVRAEQYLALAVRAGAPEASVIGPLVEACAASSRLQSALAYALPYLTAHPDAWRLRLLVAAIELALGRHELAREQLARLVRDQPHTAQAHYLLAVIARDEQDGSGASDSFAAYLRERPTGPHAAEARAFLRERPAPNPTAEASATGAQP